tara:strand:- start:114 stop:2228 length:2115 start_codon:yes stop_codon:yes gene_type:complete
MADVNKSVEITLKANIKQLQQNLEQIPGMTKKEAQAMVRALSSEFNKAQRAAKKAADANKAAAKQTAKAYQSAGKSIEGSFNTAGNAAKAAAQEIKVSFEDAEESTNQLAEGAEVLGTSMGAATLAVERLMPNLDEGAKQALELADGLATAAEQAIKGGPITGALTLATVALTAAYNSATAASRKHSAAMKEYNKIVEAADQKTKELEQSFQSIAEQTKAIDDSFGDMTKRVNQSTLELAVARGDITEAEAESLRIEQESAKIQEDASKQLERQKTLAQEFRKLKKEEADAATDQALALAAQTKNMIKGSSEREAAEKRVNELLAKAKQINQDLFSSQRKLTDEIDGFNTLQQNSLAAAKQAAQQYAEQQKALLKLRQQEEARARAAERLAQIQQIYEGLLSEQDQVETRLENRQIARLEGAERINAEARREVQLLHDKEALIIAEAEKAIEIAKSRKELAKVAELEADAVRTIARLDTERREVDKDRLIRLAELKKQQDEEERARRAEIDKEEEDRFNRRVDQQNALAELTLGSLSSIASNGLKLATDAGEKNKDLINVLFRANQAASIANIAMKTAESIAAAPAQFGPFAPAAIAAITASAAVQTGVVLAQKPPLHMGGVVQPLAPDEQSRTVLTGEAVLDRATVRRLGGETGVQRLQEGAEMSPEVIVMNPFKHLDRYNRSAIRTRGSALSRLQPTQRQKY